MVPCLVTIVYVGQRKKGKSEEQKLDMIKIDPPPVSKELKKRWSYFIRKVYETDPLGCPKCEGDLSAVAQAGMRIIRKKRVRSWLNSPIF